MNECKPRWVAIDAMRTTVAKDGFQAHEDVIGWRKVSPLRCMVVYQRGHEDTSEDTYMSSKEDAFNVNVLKFTGDIRLKQ